MLTKGMQEMLKGRTIDLSMLHRIKMMLFNIREFDVDFLASQSVFNHHVQGLDYLCLKRTEQETIKIYFIPPGIPNINSNRGYLVHPHNHRYSFRSCVMTGHLIHFRFKEDGQYKSSWMEHRYDWKSKTIDTGKRKLLSTVSREEHFENGEYYVQDTEIHTLKILSFPTVIGVIQGPDTNEDSRVYLSDECELKLSESYVPTKEQYLQAIYMVREIV